MPEGLHPNFFLNFPFFSLWKSQNLFKYDKIGWGMRNERCNGVEVAKKNGK